MNAKFRWLIVPALVVGLAPFLPAQDPAGERSAGKVLLLKNGNALEGDIIKLGTQLCVRRGASEIWIDADHAARLCADWNDAYAHLQSRLKLDSADDRLKFARWCLMHQLQTQALEQGKLAVQLSPDHREAKLFVLLAERALQDGKLKPSARAVPSATAAAPHIDVSAETFASFAALVQPILTNKCVACHAGGSFRLDRVAGGGQSAAIRNNLDQVLAYLDVDKPAQSPVLDKAVEAHGGAAVAPLKDRKEVPAQILLAWIERTIAANPRLKEHYAARKPTLAPEKIKAAAATPKADAPVLVGRSAPRIDSATDPMPGAAVKQPQAQLDYLQAMARKQPFTPPVQKIAGSLHQQIEHGPAEPGLPKVAVHPSQPLDLFDPVLFNQANHPNGPSWQGRPNALSQK